jgi:hypothetical protein
MLRGVKVPRQIGITTLAIFIAGCGVPGTTPSPSDIASSSPSAPASPPAASGSGGATQSATVDTPTPSSSLTADGALPVEGFATVVADSLVMRRAPGRSSEYVRQICIDSPDPCPIMELGTETGYTLVYLLDGPTAADGYDWYLAATDTENSLLPEYIGWVAAGDGTDAWIVEHQVDCPSDPIELADVTFAAISRLAAIHCLGGRELTLRGYYTEPPPGDPLTGECPTEPGWLFCSYGGHTLRTVVGTWAGDANHLPLKLHPDLGPMPPRPGWIEVTGQFDHPAAAECGDDPGVALYCRAEFVVTAAEASD